MARVFVRRPNRSNKTIPPLATDSKLRNNPSFIVSNLNQMCYLIVSSDLCHSTSIGAKCGYLVWSRAVDSGGSCDMAGLHINLYTYRLQLNPKIMLIESRCISQLHNFSGGASPQAPLTVARSCPPRFYFIFQNLAPMNTSC